MMKKLFNSFVAIFLVIFLVGCEGSGKVVYRYSIENQSGVDVEFKMYHINSDGDISEVKFVSLPNGKRIDRKYEDYGPYGGYNFKDFFGDLKGAQVNVLEVIYENKRKSVFLEQRKISMNECENFYREKVPCDPRNLLNTSDFMDTEEHFIITPEDYNNAIDCNGDCE